jgi:hypothetical protein
MDSTDFKEADSNKFSYLEKAQNQLNRTTNLPHQPSGSLQPSSILQLSPSVRYSHSDLKAG